MSKTTTVTPYIFFTGRCEEAIEFYKKAVGADVIMLMRYKDAPPEAMAQQCADSDPKQVAAMANQVMHARLRIGNSLVLLSDGPCSGKYDGFSLSLTLASPADAEHSYAALADGGKPEMPLTKTFFSPAFGMLNDKFGVKWMVYVDPAAA